MLTCNDYMKCFYTRTLLCREEAMNTRRNRHIGRVSGIHGEEDGLVLSEFSSFRHLQVTGVAKLGHSLKRTNADLSGLSVACHSPAAQQVPHLKAGDQAHPGKWWSRAGKVTRAWRDSSHQTWHHVMAKAFPTPPPPDLQKRISMTCVLFFSISMNWIF